MSMVVSGVWSPAQFRDEWTPEQVSEFRAALDAVIGDGGYRHKVMVLPPGPHVTAFCLYCKANRETGRFRCRNCGAPFPD